jgi:asparagine synthase (glutamine-hydrolysing)
MCGIAGFAGGGDRGDLRAMTDALAHRGPDGEGAYVDAETGVHLGHRRLVVIDPEGGGQPMWNEDGSVAVVYNGEIYNAGELRRELEARGHRFRSDHADTEVLVHGYEEWGAALPERLNGMFAVAVYDRPRRRVFLARDRFGEKPLYWFTGGGAFAFASELGALARHPECDRTLDVLGIQKLFAYGFIPSPHTSLRGCRKLPGGCRLTYDVDGGPPAVERWWRFRIEPDEGVAARSEDDLAEELRALLAQAVARRLVSDVPLGLFLSGGIDSSTVLALTARLLPAASIRTFTIGFHERSYDESHHARAVAAAIGSDHREEILDVARMRELMPSVLARLGEPLGDPSILPTHLLAAFTRRHVTVALSGDGGDELFAGYDPFRALGVAAFLDRVLPRGARRPLRRLADLLPRSTRNMSLDFKVRRGLAGLCHPRALWNPVWLAPVEPDRMADLLDAPVRAEEVYEEALALWETSASADLVDRTLEFYTNLYLQEGVLTKVDRAAMMSSLESRAVFLDNDLVEFCRRLPSRFKYRRGVRKYLLRKAMAPLVPRAVLARRKKGFGIPLAAWLREMEEPPQRAVPGVKSDAVARAWQDHRAGRADHRLLLWCWLSLMAC